MSTKPHHIYMVLFLLLAFAGCKKDITPDNDDNAAKTGYDMVFDTEDVPVLSLKLSLSEWNRLLEAYDADHDTREYVHCDVVFDKKGNQYAVPDAGLRLRGQTSRRRPEGAEGQKHGTGDWHRCHFGLNFRKFHKGDDNYDLDGVHRINLKYAKEDPSYIREKYCFDLLQRMGIWTAERASWCRLYIQVEGDAVPVYMGVYLMMEAIEDEFIEERKEFQGDDGFLWKCGWGANLRDTDDWRIGVDENLGTAYAYELKTHKKQFAKGKEQLCRFIRAVRSLSGTAFRDWIEKHCDVDLLLRTYAVFIAVGHWDDYWNDMNNFYLYFNSEDPDNYRMYMIPYDMDNTLGTTHNCGVQSDAGRHDPFNWGLDECIFISKILSIEEYRSRYRDYLKAIAAPGSEFTYEKSIVRIREWQDLIRPYLANATGEDQAIQDLPASWSNNRWYRILEDGSNNWFRIKCSVLSAL